MIQNLQKKKLGYLRVDYFIHSFIDSEGRPFIDSLLTAPKSFYIRMLLTEGVGYMKKRTWLSCCIFMSCFEALTLQSLYTCNVIIMDSFSKAIILARIISTFFSILLIFFFPPKLSRTSSQMANNSQGQSPILSDLWHSPLEKQLSRPFRTSVKSFSSTGTPCALLLGM